MKFRFQTAAAALLAASLVASYAYASDPTPPAKKQTATRKAKTPPPPTVAEQIQALKQELEGVPQVAEEFQTQIIELQGDNKLTLDTFGSVQNAVDRKIQEKLRTLQGQMDAFQGYILPAMQKFLQQYPQERASLMAEIAYGSEFIKLRDEIKGEELHKHHERFFSLLNT